ncbi:hypothetical protein D3C84_103650 [compost metagenome]
MAPGLSGPAAAGDFAVSPFDSGSIKITPLFETAGPPRERWSLKIDQFFDTPAITW